MALKSGPFDQAVDIEDLLDHVEKTLDRVKVLYEQYFLGMQKQPPTHMHTDVERRLRDLMQIQIRNTGLRYRFATVQQKFGSYNSYWRRTLRQIENGTHLRQLSKIGRQAALTGEEVPEEILAAMPKRMREQVKRDREHAIAIAARRREEAGPAHGDALLDAAPAISAPPQPQGAKTREPHKSAHILSEDDLGLDIDSFFAAIEAGDAPAEAAAKSAPATRPSAPAMQTGPQPAIRPSAPSVSQTGPQPAIRPSAPSISQTGPQPAIGGSRPSVPGTTGARPAVPSTSQTGPHAAIPGVPQRPSAPGAPTLGPRPTVPSASQTGPTPTVGAPQRPSVPPPPPRPGASARPPSPPAAARRPDPGAPVRPPPGMNDADVNALYAKYVKAKEMVGETAGPGAYSKLVQTINTQAPKIMEQYKAKGVEFSVVVKDNQVVIKAKPKT